MPPIINPMDGIEALKAAKERVSLTADNMRTTAKQYQETDEENSASFDPLLENQQNAPTGPQMAGGAPAGSAPGGPQQQGEPAKSAPAEHHTHPASRSEPAEPS